MRQPRRAPGMGPRRSARRGSDTVIQGRVWEGTQQGRRQRGAAAARQKAARARHWRQRQACPRGGRRPQGTVGSGGWQVRDAVPAFPAAKSHSFWFVFL